MIGQVGPAALLLEDPPPEAPLDPRVRVNEGQVRRAARTICSLSEVSPFPFVGPELPPIGHPKAVDYLFSATRRRERLPFHERAQTMPRNDGTGMSVL
jgi:hypothetical protein